jgi:hypothetical protein
MASSLNAATSGGGGVIVTSDASGDLNIQSGGSTVVAVTSAGVAVTGTLSASGASTFTGTGKFATTIGVGNATPSASGSGITFPATQSPSSDANTLDDYEEGTFTPILVSTGATFAYTTQLGAYTKIGRQVTCLIRLYVSASGTVTNPTSIGGLPFTVSAVPSGGGFVTFSNMTVQPNINCVASTTTAEIIAQLTAGDLSPTALGISGVSKYLSCVIIYTV